MKQKLLVVGLPLVIALASAPADAAKRAYEQSGVGCIQAFGSENSIDRTQYGVHNTSSTAAVTVECPVNISEITSAAQTISVFGVTAYDRSPSADVNCDIQRLDGNGNVSFTANLKTTGSGAAAQGLTVSPNSVLIQGTWRLRCSLPATVVGGGGFNHLVQYGMITNE